MLQVLFPLASALLGTTWYVSELTEQNGAGTRADPWQFSQVNNANISNGDEIVFLAEGHGNYFGK